jgi:cation diffusion facilitator family transporter
MGYTVDRSIQGKASRAFEVRKVLWIVLFLNVAVAVAKMAWGGLIGSVAMVADGFHSLFDGASNIVGLVGMKAASKPADKDHPYGHGKYETVASAAIGAMLALAAWRVGSTAFTRLVGGGGPERVDAGAFVVMTVTLCVNLLVTRYERARGRALGSDILLADARHTGSDVLVSLGVIGGLVAVKLGYPVADPIIALGVAVVIGWTAIGVFRHANETLSDRARLPVSELRAAAQEVPGVDGAHDVRTRGSASEVYVDMHVQVDPSMTVADAHAVAESVERELCARFTQIVDIIVHVEPLDAYQLRKTADQAGVDPA